MDLLKTAESLLQKVKEYQEACSENQDDAFRLREDIRAASGHIHCLLDGPEQAMHTLARQYTVCTALKICADLEVASALSQGPLSLSDLAHATSCDYRVLRPLLRVLAQHGVFAQATDGKWHHTPMSNVINEKPFRAWLNSILEEKYKSTAHLPTYLARTTYRMPSTGRTAYNQIYNTPLDFYTFVNENNRAASENFAVSMRELARTQLPFIEQCYPFARIAAGARFVDIASGEGNLSFFLAKQLPNATFELQDHETVLTHAREACPPALAERISFRSHDMFQEQPPIDRTQHREGVVFMLKIILHDHDDDQCRTILNAIIPLMTPEDRLLVIETVLPESGGSLSSSLSDVIILSMFGSGHRTLEEWKTLMHSCGNVDIDTFGGGFAEFDGMIVFELRTSLSSGTASEQ